MYLDNFALGFSRRNAFTRRFQPVDVKLDGLLDKNDNFRASFRSCDAPRKVRHICSVSIFAFFDYDEIFHVLDFIPACLRILFSVPGGMSIPGFPDTVTVPRFEGCLNCRWLPRVRTSTQPSFFNSRRSIRTFINPGWQDT